MTVTDLPPPGSAFFFILILVPRQEEEEIILVTDGNISAVCLDTVLIFVYSSTREQSSIALERG